MRAPKRRPFAALLVIVLLAMPLAACEKVTRGVRASVSPCFRILPQAHQALGGQGAFVDVARIQGRAVTGFPPLVRPAATGATGVVTRAGSGPATTSTSGAPPTSTSGPTTTVARASRDICVVAYKGAFDTSRIEHLIGLGRTGPYALVVVAVRTQRVRAVILVNRLPPPLHGH